MESDHGKIFIGGISWDTNEDRLREYFTNFGEVVEAFIMKDRTTGRARGFGFVVFANPAVADRVVMEKHQIDGRMVEAKKAVPRDDPHILNRNNNSIQGSPGPSPARTKKVFVGGLATTVTENDFRKYFEQFGTIIDAIVMYDHNTQRPRGFGFITFDSEDAVDKLLYKAFHELNGKMVEVKRAVPKELSPGPNLRLPVGEYNHGMNRISNFLNGYNQGYNPCSLSTYGMRMDGRFGPSVGGRKGFPSLSTSYGVGMNFDLGMNQNYGGSSNFNNNLGYGRPLSQYYGGNSNRFSSPIGFRGGNGNSGSTFSSASRSLWDNGGINYGITGSNSYMNSGSGSIAGFGNSGMNLGGLSSPFAAHGIGRSSSFRSGSLKYVTGESDFGLVGGRYGRGSGTGTANSSFIATSSGSFEGNYNDSYGGNSIYGDPTWQSAPKVDGYSPFGYGFGSTASGAMSKGDSISYMGDHNVSNRKANKDG